MFTEILKDKKKVVIIGIFLVLFILTILIQFLPKKKKTDNTNKPTSTNSSPNNKSYPFDTKPFENGYQVGNVKITLDDIEYEWGKHNPETPEARNNKKKWEEAANELTRNAIIQNEAQKLNIPTATPSTNNPTNTQNISPTGTSSKYDPSYVKEAKKAIIDQQTTYISLEKISIFFNNFIDDQTPNPKIGIPQAKLRAFNIMTNLHNRLIKGQITMKQAGDEIINNPQLEDIDISYQNNAYGNYNKIRKEDNYFDPTMQEIAWTLDPEQISDVLISKIGGIEYNYSIIKVNEKKNSQYQSLDDYIQQKEQEYNKISI